MNEWKSLLDAAAACRPVREKWTMRTDYAPLPRALIDVTPPPEPDCEPRIKSEEESRLDQIARLVRALVYGDVMQLGAEMWKAKEPTKGNRPITQADLPMMFHRWATRGMA
jgi:hypothetical protein